MNRKTIKFNKDEQFVKSKRTTIYLSIDIPIIKPTHQINQQLLNLPSLKETLNQRKTYIELFKKIIYQMRENKEKNSYQITVYEKHWSLLREIKVTTGLTYSELAELCFILKNR